MNAHEMEAELVKYTVPVIFITKAVVSAEDVGALLAHRNPLKTMVPAPGLA